ncbi:Protein NLP8 [Vitis vinifera]|uniref:Protein NLP8 n=1 Tax=Vitis vinifera TaxID=29760 RepID=A0A438DFV0_VITVI|nr:Protein NLP8 [Vitis vinifera]
MTASSNSSASMVHASSSSSPSFERQLPARGKTKVEDGGSKITVKATYKEDTIRFKFEPSAGCFQLYDEVARRFGLQIGTFQLKYLDDEEEWVMLLRKQQLLPDRWILAGAGRWEEEDGHRRKNFEGSRPNSAANKELEFGHGREGAYHILKTVLLFVRSVPADAKQVADAWLLPDPRSGEMKGRRLDDKGAED